jgi:competence ComEA-like helix-hairpin-helix protein
MRFFLDLDSKLGITRSDVTVLLFLTAAALAGFLYTTFLDRRPPSVEGRELRALIHRHDSILYARQHQALAELDSARADSIPAWNPAGAGTPGDTVGGKPKGASYRKEDHLKGPVDINHATERELEMLPGVGGGTAAAIVEERGHGAFKSVADITRVPGIGAKKFERLKKYIVVRKHPAGAP